MIGFLGFIAAVIETEKQQTDDLYFVSIKNFIGPYQRTPKQVARAIRYPGLGVRSVGPVGDFLDCWFRTIFGHAVG